jgi:penicillin-binding protein 1A
MSDRLDDSDRRASGVAGLREGTPPGRRSAAAGREFAHALAGDLRVLLAAIVATLAAGATRLKHASARLGLSLTQPLTLPASDARLARAARAERLRRSPGRGWATAGGRVVRFLVFGIGFIVLIGSLAAAGAMAWALRGLPLDRPMNTPTQPAVLLEAANGQQLGRVGPLTSGDVKFEDYPPMLLKAVVSVEDRRFYQHFGVDPIGMLRAAHRNMQAGGIEEGGSTITQQLVKVRYGDKERTYGRKVREALAAVWLETHLSKNEILTRYLSSVYLGAGAYGMAAAARLYFDKRLADLTLPEAAMLAGLIKAPTPFNPLSHLQAAQTRAATVLDTMVDTGAIDAKAAEAAKAHPATTKMSPALAPARSWYTDWVAGQAIAAAGERTDIVRVRTTLRPDMQRLAQTALDQVLSSQGRRMGASQGALVAMRPDGAVLAMVGGRDYRASQFNRAVDAIRQPGSSFKLFVYLTALRKGYSPWDMVDARAVDIKGWEPENYGGAHYGRIPLIEAFAKSVNTAAVRLATQVGLKDVIATARDLGITTPISPTPSLALGAYGVNLLEMTGAFASVQVKRMPLKPWGVAAVGAADGGALESKAPQPPTQTLDPYAQPMTEMLQAVVEHGTGRGAALDGFAAGKTGTSQDYHDAWFIGFNEALIVGVWVGNDDNRPMRHVTGGSLPATIWKQFMTAAAPLVGREGAAIAAAPSEAPPEDTDHATQATTGQASGGACDVQVCAGIYRSFRASDCTYQPYSGARRRLCEVGARQAGPAERNPQETTGAGGAQAQCNIQACSRFYSSFDPSDCTYQPFRGGARQLCER